MLFQKLGVQTFRKSHRGRELVQAYYRSIVYYSDDVFGDVGVITNSPNHATK